MPKTTFNYGNQQVTLESGIIARQATSSVLVTMGETVVLVTVVCAKESDVTRDFFPLTVVYQVRTYGSGKIPGGFFKREGRPSESEILISRLIDRPIRPLFDEQFTNEIQIVATVISIDPKASPDIAALLGTSAALAISGLPFNGPIGAARVGFKDGAYLLNPNATELEGSRLDLVVAGTETAVLMVESEAKELSESEMLEAVMFGHTQMQTAIKAIKEFASQTTITTWKWQPHEVNQTLAEQLKSQFETNISDAYKVADKLQRLEKLSALRDKAVEQFVPATAENKDLLKLQLKELFEKLQAGIVRTRILDNQPRIDGRDGKTIRPISIVAGLLPRTHGSALFTRGETQAIVVSTLGTERDAQMLDEGETKDNFMLHYNFPPYCVGEIGMMGSPKRREIGHGWLAKRAIRAVLPTQEAFPYSLRIVSEITESNGSSSMATVCGASLSLMDAGVPISGQVAGIAMGLVKEGSRFAVLSDILGDEDHLGDMDFKVAGTAKGVTALQMDIKIDGITREIMQVALSQAKEGRLHILNEMNRVLSTPRTDMSRHAPKIVTLQINPERIKDVIGKGGATIRAITEETGVQIDISDDGLIKIYSSEGLAAEAAIERIKFYTDEVEIGRIYEGKVEKIMDFGAFVTILPGKSGLVHISQISEERVEDVNEYLTEGQVIQVKVLEIDRQGRIRLSMKALSQQEQA